ncbi:hypothetical protein GMRT_12456 [Giardia muris]|uniref:Uncharacterized protein n=1 Tax=Giardia muris TaxID=5742 RepID=A0A4Z1SNT4_GIAMU|nr:hypothetical protein GMRT_12456 [Giardia muris]|eukprot:TNJ27474.1 hypothetical protein GMRT_12456 [Giardia muris]
MSAAISKARDARRAAHGATTFKPVQGQGKGATVVKAGGARIVAAQARPAPPPRTPAPRVGGAPGVNVVQQSHLSHLLQPKPLDPDEFGGAASLEELPPERTTAGVSARSADVLEAAGLKPPAVDVSQNRYDHQPPPPAAPPRTYEHPEPPNPQDNRYAEEKARLANPGGGLGIPGLGDRPTQQQQRYAMQAQPQPSSGAPGKPFAKKKPSEMTESEWNEYERLSAQRYKAQLLERAFGNREITAFERQEVDALLREDKDFRREYEIRMAAKREQDAERTRQERLEEQRRIDEYRQMEAEQAQMKLNKVAHARAGVSESSTPYNSAPGQSSVHVQGEIPSTTSASLIAELKDEITSLRGKLLQAEKDRVMSEQRIISLEKELFGEQTKSAIMQTTIDGLREELEALRGKKGSGTGTPQFLPPRPRHPGMENMPPSLPTQGGPEGTIPRPLSKDASANPSTPRNMSRASVSPKPIATGTGSTSDKVPGGRVGSSPAAKAPLNDVMAKAQSLLTKYGSSSSSGAVSRNLSTYDATHRNRICTVSSTLGGTDMLGPNIIEPSLLDNSLVGTVYLPTNGSVIPVETMTPRTIQQSQMAVRESFIPMVQDSSIQSFYGTQTIECEVDVLSMREHDDADAKVPSSILMDTSNLSSVIPTSLMPRPTGGGDDGSYRIYDVPEQSAEGSYTFDEYPTSPDTDNVSEECEGTRSLLARSSLPKEKFSAVEFVNSAITKPTPPALGSSGLRPARIGEMVQEQDGKIESLASLASRRATEFPAMDLDDGSLLEEEDSG